MHCSSSLCLNLTDIQMALHRRTDAVFRQQWLSSIHDTPSRPSSSVHLCTRSTMLPDLVTFDRRFSSRSLVWRLRTRQTLGSLPPPVLRDGKILYGVARIPRARAPLPAAESVGSNAREDRAWCSARAWTLRLPFPRAHVEGLKSFADLAFVQDPGIPN